MESLVELLPHWEAVNVLDDEFGETHFELRLSEPPVVSVVADRGGYIDEAIVEDGTMHMSIHLPSTVDVRRMVDTIQDVYPVAEMVGNMRRRRRRRPAPDTDSDRSCGHLSIARVDVSPSPSFVESMSFHSNATQNGPVCERVVCAVANANGVDTTDLEPLYDSIDPEALDALFKPGVDGTVRFAYEGCDVVVHGDGNVRVDGAEVDVNAVETIGLADDSEAGVTGR